MRLRILTTPTPRVGKGAFTDMKTKNIWIVQYLCIQPDGRKVWIPAGSHCTRAGARIAKKYLLEEDSCFVGARMRIKKEVRYNFKKGILYEVVGG
jgi:hypothetical protein